MDPNETSHAAPEAPVPVELVEPPPCPPPPLPPPRPRRKPSLLRRLLVALAIAVGVVLAVGVVVMAATGTLSAALAMLLTGEAPYPGPPLQEKYVSHEVFASNKIAIITIDGMILDGDTFIKQQIDHVAHDKKVKAVVLRIDSPGGTVSGADYIYHHLVKLSKERKIPIVVSMGSLAASGGYYVAMSVGDRPDTIYAERSTWTGSIGVVVPLYNISDLMTKYGVRDESIATHPLKEMGSFTRPMSEGEPKVWAELVAAGFTQFKDVIKSGRPKFRKDPDALDKLATGQVYTAAQAKELGLIDKIGFVEDAVDRAIELAKLPKDEVKVIRYSPEPTLSDLLLGAQARPQPLDLSTLLEGDSPRAYYLYTRLPPLVKSGR